MTNPWTPAGTAWALRAAALVVTLVASVGLAAPAGASTPAPFADDTSATRTTDPSPSAGADDASRTRATKAPRSSEADNASTIRTTTTPIETDALSTRMPATSPAGEPSDASGTATPGTSPSAEVGEAGWVLAVRPATQTVREGQTATFTAAFTPSAASASPITVRWQTARARTGPWTDLAAPTGAVLTSTATLSLDGHLFRAVVSTALKSSSSASVILRVQPLPASPPADPPSCPTPPPAPPAGPGAGCPGPPPPSPTPSTFPTTPSVPAALATPTALTATPTDIQPATPTAEAPYGTVALPVLTLGQEQTATGHNFEPGTLVKITLEPAGIDLGTYPAGPDGTVTARFTTTRLTPGTHTVQWTPA